MYGSDRIKCMQIQDEINESNKGEEIAVQCRKANVQASKRNVPLAEYQDFESQISCTTIEKNAGGELDMVISDGEDEGRITVADAENVTAVTNSSGTSAGSAVGSVSNERKCSGATTNIVSKVANEKGVAAQRRELSLAPGLVEVSGKRLIVNCDKKPDECSEHSESDAQRANSLCSKRSYEALKSVRIPKKAERAADFNKRQRIDET